MLNIRLKYLRKLENKTQQDIADMLGITRPAYTAYEQGKRSPDYDLLEKLADFYSVTIDYLLGRTDNPQPFYSTPNALYGDGIKKARNQLGLTINEIAEKTGIPVEVYTKYEEDGIIDVKHERLLQTFFNNYEKEQEFQAFANDPSLQKWYKDLPKNREEDLQRLRKMWEILKDSGEIK